MLSKSAAKKCEERKESDYSDLGMAQTCEFSKTICLTIPTLYVSFKGVQDTKMIEKLEHFPLSAESLRDVKDWYQKMYYIWKGFKVGPCSRFTERCT